MNNGGLDWSAWAYEALPKTVLYAAVLLVVGTAASRWMLNRFAGSPLAEETRELDRVLERLAPIASSLALAALLVRTLGHTATVFGASGALHWSNLRVIAMESRWGQAWRLQTVSAATSVACAFGIRLSRRIGWLLYTIAAFGLCVVIPRLGHGAVSGTHLVLHILHLVGVSAWLGTLAVIVLLYFRGWASDSVVQIKDTLEIVLHHFSKIALPSAALTLLTGAVAAVIYVGTFSSLFTTPYGRILLLKIAGVAGIVVCGWRNWRHLRTLKPPRPRTLIAETVFMAAVLVITGVLTETEHP